MFEKLSLFVSWVEAHPRLAELVLWPFALAVFTMLFKPKTPGEYAQIASRRPEAFWRRWAAFTQLTGALGIDPVKVLALVKKIAIGRYDDQKPPKGPSVLPMLLLVLPLALTQASCTPQARWALLDLLADKAQCAIAHQDLPDSDIIKVCSVEPGDVQKVLDILGQARMASAKAAADASNRAGASKCVEPPKHN